MATWRTLAACCLIACAVPPAPPVQAPPPALERPPAWTVQTAVMASAEMSPQCRHATYAAVTYLVGMGAMLTVTWVEQDHPSISLEPRPEQIAISAGLTNDPSALVETLQMGPRRGEVVVGYCSTWLITHELAHLLGMESRLPTDVLMHLDGIR